MKDLIKGNNYTKAAVKKAAAFATNDAIKKGKELELIEGVAAMEKVCKAVRESPEFTDAVVTILNKYGGCYESASGTIIEVAEVGVKYDYSHDSEWNILNDKLKQAQQALKDRETILKAVKEGKERVDESTGEVVQGANKGSKTSYRITLSK